MLESPTVYMVSNESTYKLLREIFQFKFLTRISNLTSKCAQYTTSCAAGHFNTARRTALCPSLGSRWENLWLGSFQSTG